MVRGTENTIGVLWPRFNGTGAAAGMAAGTILAARLTLSGLGKVWGWHAGVLGLALNVIVGISVSWAGRGAGSRQGSLKNQPFQKAE